MIVEAIVWILCGPISRLLLKRAGLTAAVAQRAVMSCLVKSLQSVLCATGGLVVEQLSGFKSPGSVMCGACGPIDEECWTLVNLKRKVRSLLYNVW
jgi:hypothetical protein